MAYHFYQIIVVVVAAVMLLQGLRRIFLHLNGQSTLKILARIVVWGGMIVVALFPSITDKIAQFIGMEGNINAVILIGFILVFVIIFRILSIIERIERDLSILTRKKAVSKFSEDFQLPK